MKNYLINYYSKFNRLLNDVDYIKFENVQKLIFKIKKNKKKLIIVGNGGSAAMASHVSVDFTKIGKIRCVNFNEADLLTCFSNDYGYEHWVSNALNFYADKGDLIILISSSGKSKNIVNGAKTALKKKCELITFSGFDRNNTLSKLGKYNFWVNSKNYNIIENIHQVWLLSIVDKIANSKI